jgi:lysophospholipase L1-like esterase
VKLAVLIAVLIAFIMPDCRAANVETTTSGSAQASLTTEAVAYRAERMAQFLGETSAPLGVVVFIGDGNTERFPLELLDTTYTIVNRAIARETIGGAGAEGLLERIETTVAPLKPIKIFILTGGTDLSELQTPPDTFQASYSQLLQKLKSTMPSAQIYVQGILPFRKEWSKHNDTVRVLNKRLQAIARSEQVTFIPIHNHFTDPRGYLLEEVTSDGVQLNVLGYRKWAAILKRYLGGE